MPGTAPSPYRPPPSPYRPPLSPCGPPLSPYGEFVGAGGGSTRVLVSLHVSGVNSQGAEEAQERVEAVQEAALGLKAVESTFTNLVAHLALNIRLIALNVHTIALNIRILALSYVTQGRRSKTTSKRPYVVCVLTLPAHKAQSSTEALVESMDTVAATVTFLEDANLMAGEKQWGHMMAKRRTDKQ
eukprot:1836881-Pyramimonas_sp.AAC.1